MTRDRRRDLEDRLDELAGRSEWTAPFTRRERERLEASRLDADAWGATPQRRAIYRALSRVAGEADRS